MAIRGELNMDIAPKQVLDLAAKYIGYKEKASDKDPYYREDSKWKAY